MRLRPRGRLSSVFLSTWWPLPDAHPSPGIDWSAVLALKADVSRELERLRVAGGIGAPLEAEVDVYLDAAQRARLAGLGEELRFVLITSEARMLEAGDRPADAVPAAGVAREGAWIAVRPRGHAKCARCWHWREDVGAEMMRPNPDYDPAAELPKKGKKKAVVLDLKTHRAVWEDFCDVLRAKEREDEPRESLDSVKKKILKRA